MCDSVIIPPVFFFNAGKETQMISLRLTTMSTKAANSGYYVPSVRCLPAADTGLTVCAPVTHIPCVCMSTFPQGSHLRGGRKTFHLPTAVLRIAEMPFTHSWLLNANKSGSAKKQLRNGNNNKVNTQSACFGIQIIT